MSRRKSFAIRHPWTLVCYLLAVTLTAFLLPQPLKPIGVASLFALQLVVLAVFKSLDWSLIRIFQRLRFLFLFLIGMNALLPGAVDDTYWTVPGLGWSINLSGLLSGVLMSSQIALVVLTTHVIRKIGDQSSFINGLRSLRVTPLLAYSLDTTLAMLDGSLDRYGGGGGRGRGDGSGGGHGGHHRHRGRWRIFGGRGGHGGGRGAGREPTSDTLHQSRSEADRDGGIFALFKALKSRDLTPVVENVRKVLHDASRHAERLGLNPQRAHDVAVVGGIGAAMMAFKLVKVLPGLPVMPGIKTIFFIPLYILAADRTHSRWGATTAGTIMGFIGFLNGDSRYGIFEVLKHLVPGLVVDLVWPFVRLFPLRLWILVGVGLLAAAARTSTQFAMILALGSDNASLLVFPAFKLVPNAIAGSLSALVSYPMLKHLGRDADLSASLADSDRPKGTTADEAAASPVDVAEDRPVASSEAASPGGKSEPTPKIPLVKPTSSITDDQQ